MRRLHRHTPTLAGTVEVVAVATAPVGLNDPSSTVTLYNLPTLLAPDISDESTMIAALFHDLGKVGYPGKPHYLLNENRWEVEKRNKTYRTKLTTGSKAP